MKRFLLALLFLFSTSVFAQQTIDFETVGNTWVWNLFAAGTGGIAEITANPSVGGLNTSANCLKIVAGADGANYAGAYCTDFTDMLITADNCIVKILVYKDVTSRFNLKLEPPNFDHFDSNTVVNQWEELTFDYSSSIGTTGITLTLIPDMEDGPRTHASVNYIDNIRFTSLPGSTVNFETNGNAWNWIPFDASKATFDIVANPGVGGLNITDSSAMLQITDVTADPWLGVFSPDFPDFTFDESNCIVRILVYKDHISNVGLKIEPARTSDYNIPNTVINQWEEIIFDYSAYIGLEAKTLVVIPDFAPGPPRTYTSTSYFDEVRFTSQVVPVELTSFTGAIVGNDVQLKWATATELNNRGFEIQRSISGSAFATIAFVEGYGTTTEQKQYSFTDRNVTAGVDHSYRLKQIDFDGTFDYSNVVNVGSAIPTKFALEQNYPNPFNPSTNFIYSVPVKSNVTLDVYNLIGQKLVTLFEGDVEAGKHSAQFNASSLSSGMYFFTLTAVGEDGSQFSSSKKMTLLK